MDLSSLSMTKQNGLSLLLVFSEDSFEKVSSVRRMKRQFLSLKIDENIYRLPNKINDQDKSLTFSVFQMINKRF